MKNRIEEIAHGIGIDRIAFTNTIKYDYLLDILNYRVINKYNSEFEYADINKRIDASFLMLECKSIITVILPYAKAYQIPKKENMGNLSVSSYGLDYHKVLHQKLENLVNEIKKDIQFKYKICVDNTPLNDRAICYESGLGYVGKNSMLIDDEYGSFVFLGSILTDLEITANNEFDNRLNNNTSKNNNRLSKCGNCNICINKCPNNAIMDNNLINAKRCVSYLTQTKEYIPIEYRKAMGNQIYGCDICQINCPKNSKALSQSSKENYDSLLIDLRELFNITNKEFDLKYGYMAGSWRGKNIWKRNAIIACANMELHKFSDLIKNELYGDSDMFKIYASWALLKLNVQNSKDLIYNRLKYENEFIKNEYNKLLEMY